MIVFIIFINGYIFLRRKINQETICLNSAEKELRHLMCSNSAEPKFVNRRELETYLFSSESSEFYTFVKMKDRSTISRQTLELILSVTGIGLLLLLGGNVGNNHLHYTNIFFLYGLGVFFLGIVYSIFKYESIEKKSDRVIQEIKKVFRKEHQ